MRIEHLDQVGPLRADPLGGGGSQEQCPQVAFVVALERLLAFLGRHAAVIHTIRDAFTLEGRGIRRESGVDVIGIDQTLLAGVGLELSLEILKRPLELARFVKRLERILVAPERQRRETRLPQSGQKRVHPLQLVPAQRELLVELPGILRWDLVPHGGLQSLLAPAQWHPHRLLVDIHTFGGLARLVIDFATEQLPQLLLILEHTLFADVAAGEAGEPGRVDLLVPDVALVERLGCDRLLVEDRRQAGQVTGRVGDRRAGQEQDVLGLLGQFCRCPGTGGVGIAKPVGLVKDQCLGRPLRLLACTHAGVGQDLRRGVGELGDLFLVVGLQCCRNHGGIVATGVLGRGQAGEALAGAQPVVEQQPPVFGTQTITHPLLVRLELDVGLQFGGLDGQFGESRHSGLRRMWRAHNRDRTSPSPPRVWTSRCQRPRPSYPAPHQAGSGTSPAPETSDAVKDPLALRRGPGPG